MDPDNSIGEEENEMTTSERKEDGEESRKAGRAPLSRIPTFQSALARKRVTVQSAESSPKMDVSSQPGQKERTGSTEPGRVKMSVYGGRETALPFLSVNLNTSSTDVLSQGDISTSSPPPLKRDHAFDQTPENTVDADEVKSALQRPPLRKVQEKHVTSDLITEPLSEFETASGETLSEDEHISTQDAVLDDLSSCSSVDHQETSDQPCGESLIEDFEEENETETVYQPEPVQENCVRETDVKQLTVPDKVDGDMQDESAKREKPSDRKDSTKCLKETRKTIKAEDDSHAKQSKTRMYTPSKKKGRSCPVFCLLPSVLLLLGGFGLHVWQYGIPKSASHLMSQLELHWLESFWMPQETCTSDCLLLLRVSRRACTSLPGRLTCRASQMPGLTY
ncbi:hypothetical protein E1301_Tti013228 [Triplophysa tibetana]|uniref:Uncharacterized protein n=1 Tax=Triplophysa tibetana TaxID=1572043 RepID=A0A5A9NIQ6_9TELE|nr:hypothetical protein E1301_Tti013228 [Triplophysa tibetana]